jgi:hypothetical protein
MGALFSSLGGSLSSILSFFTAGRNYKLLVRLLTLIRTHLIRGHPR